MIKKILIVEDDRLYCQYLKSILGKQYPDHQLLTSVTVNEAWDIMKNNSWNEQYDFVVLDVMLPETSGWGLLHRMEKHFAPGKGIPKVIINSTLNLSQTYCLPEQGKIKHTFIQKPILASNVVDYLCAN